MVDWMKAAILTIGDEIMIGQIVDSNSAWISAILDKYGYKITRKLAVGDDIEEIKKGIDLCRATADVLILTGGLGPTSDDMTVDALTQYFHTRKVWNEETWQRVLAIVKFFGREASDMHKLQCYLPESAEIIKNDQGTAPGMIFRDKNLILVSLPGVPSEMKHLLKDKIIPLLPKGNPVEHRFIRTAGEGETALAEMIKDIEDGLPKEIKLAYLPSYGFVTLRLTSHAPDQVTILDDLQARIVERLGKVVYGTGDTNLSKAVGQMLRERKETLGTGESCTGGYLAHLITSIPDSSDYYLGSIIPYAYEIKTSELGISEELLKYYGAVSEEVVSAMAKAVREKLGVTWALSTSGIAGPGGATPTKPVGTIWIACAGPGGILKTRLLKLNRDRIGNIEYTAIAALILLRKCMLEQG
jgi:nicotinamide-nucleotide amidase